MKPSPFSDDANGPTKKQLKMFQELGAAREYTIINEDGVSVCVSGHFMRMMWMVFDQTLLKSLEALANATREEFNEHQANKPEEVANTIDLSIQSAAFKSAVNEHDFLYTTRDFQLVEKYTKETEQ